MIRRLSIATTVAALALTAACDSSDKTDPDQQASEAGDNARTAKGVSVPVKEDFELEAEASINEDNVEQSVVSLEREIGEDES
jgi:hypothetical protein